MDKIVGIETGKKDAGDQEWEFNITLKDGELLKYRGIFIASNDYLPGFLQIIPKDSDTSITIVAGDLIKTIVSKEI